MLHRLSKNRSNFNNKYGKLESGYMHVRNSAIWSPEYYSYKIGRHDTYLRLIFYTSISLVFVFAYFLVSLLGSILH